MSRFYSNVLFYNSFFFFFGKILRKYRNVSDNLLSPPPSPLPLDIILQEVSAFPWKIHTINVLEVTRLSAHSRPTSVLSRTYTDISICYWIILTFPQQTRLLQVLMLRVYYPQRWGCRVAFRSSSITVWQPVDIQQQLIDQRRNGPFFPYRWIG